MLYAFKLGRKLRGEEPYCPEKGGKGGSSDKSAKYAAEAQKYAADLQNQQFNTIMNNLKPFTPLADKYVGSLENLSSLEGQGQALNQYYNSQQYKDLAGQARYQSLAAAEATGGSIDKTTFSASFMRAFLFLTAAAWLTEQSCHILKSQIAKQMKKMVDSDIYTPTSLVLSMTKLTSHQAGISHILFLLSRSIHKGLSKQPHHLS